MNIFELPVHPAADRFPMLDFDELSELAADIKANGLRHPVVVGVVDGVEMLIDGRNRLAACKMAGLDPEINQLNGADPVDTIRSFNLMRRDLKKSQQAMLLAEMYPESGVGGRGKKGHNNVTVSTEYIKQARLVIKYAPEMVDGVINGSPLDTAYTEAKRRKVDAETRQQRLDDLKEKAGDLYDLVFEERMELSEAEAAFERRVAETHAPRKGQVESICNNLGMAVNGAASLSGKTFDQFMEWIDDEDVAIELKRKFPDGKKSLIQMRDRFESGVEQINSLITILENK